VVLGGLWYCSFILFGFLKFWIVPRQSGQIFPGYPVEIFKNAFPLKGMADFWVPLEPIDMPVRECNRLGSTDG
jgi:hypothetical protein